MDVNDFDNQSFITEIAKENKIIGKGILMEINKMEAVKVFIKTDVIFFIKYQTATIKPRIIGFIVFHCKFCK